MVSLFLHRFVVNGPAVCACPSSVFTILCLLTLCTWTHRLSIHTRSHSFRLQIDMLNASSAWGQRQNNMSVRRIFAETKTNTKKWCITGRLWVCLKRCDGFRCWFSHDTSLSSHAINTLLTTAPLEIHSRNSVYLYTNGYYMCAYFMFGILSFSGVPLQIIIIIIFNFISWIL